MGIVANGSIARAAGVCGLVMGACGLGVAQAEPLTRYDVGYEGVWTDLPQVDPRMSSTQAIGRYSAIWDAKPAIVVGDPTGSPSVTPSQRVDANVPTSAFAGVVSINPRNAPHGSFLCTGTAISDRHILTAAHCFDLAGGVEPDSDPTGDGISDFLPGDITVFLNDNNPSSNMAGTTSIGVSQVDLHPDWHGFLNNLGPEGPSLNDDLAILTLDSPLPSSVPIYPIQTQPFVSVEEIVMAGYGTTGDGVSGFDANSANFFVKRSGFNAASSFDLDDEAPNTAREVFLFDFDGPDLTTSTLDTLGTLGNDLETVIGPGDSGGPSFLWSDDGDTVIEADELTLFGVNTFTLSTNQFPSPLFGSLAGGMTSAEYAQWIQAVIPEPSAISLVAIGLFAMLGRRQHGNA